MSERIAIRVSEESGDAIKTIQVDRDLGNGEAADFLIKKGYAKYTAEHKYQAVNGKPKTPRAPKAAKKASKKAAKKASKKAAKKAEPAAAVETASQAEECVRLRVAGLSNVEISEKLQLSKDQVYRLLKKA